MTIKTIIIAALTLTLTGCPIYHISQSPRSQPLSAPEILQTNGLFIHDYTKITFPETIDEFHRTNVAKYDTAAANISVGYNEASPNCPITATIYVFPRPPMNYIGAAPEVVASIENQILQNVFSATKNDIVHAHSNAKLIAENQLAFGEKKAWVAKYSDGPAITIAKVLIYDLDWIVKYRYTFPATCEPQAQQAVGKLEEGLRLY